MLSPCLVTLQNAHVGFDGYVVYDDVIPHTHCKKATKKKKE